MCICINCHFYKRCWIHKGLNKIPKVYTKTFLSVNLKHLNKRHYTWPPKEVFFKVFLNIFLKKQNYEFDVIECEGFCENPGQWLK